MNNARRTVLVLATGGTIGMHHTERGLAPDPAFPEHLEERVAAICTTHAAEYRINHLNPPVDSANASSDTAPRIARAIGARVRTSRPRGVVVLHGTDTLAFTASRLAFDLSGIGAPVIVTGSQLPFGVPGSDAPDNLALAIRASLSASAQAPVSIAFGDELLPAVRATKHHADALGAFRAERALGPNPVGVGAATQQYSSLSRSNPARVTSFRFTPGITAEDLRGAAHSLPDGLVLECYGSGNAPLHAPGMVDALREITSRIPVVAITQCAGGGVNFSRYAVAQGMTDAGVLDGGDMTLEAALAKLSYLLDQGAHGASIEGLMGFNLIGERT